MGTVTGDLSDVAGLILAAWSHYDRTSFLSPLSRVVAAPRPHGIRVARASCAKRLVMLAMFGPLQIRSVITRTKSHPQAGGPDKVVLLKERTSAITQQHNWVSSAYECEHG